MRKTRRGVAPRSYTLEEKVALVTKIDQLYRAGNISLKAAAAAAGTTDTSYQTWLRAGIRPQPVAPARPGAARLYEPEERERLLAAVDGLRARGKGVLAACREIGISDKSYRKWRAAAAPPPAMVPVEVTALVPVAPVQGLTLAPPRPVAGVQPSGGLTLVAPGGYRVEGLAVETAAALLRALA
jgi:transposase-like protein